MIAAIPWQHFGEGCKQVIQGPAYDKVVVDTADEGNQEHTNTNTCQDRRKNTHQ